MIGCVVTTIRSKVKFGSPSFVSADVLGAKFGKITSTGDRRGAYKPKDTSSITS